MAFKADDKITGLLHALNLGDPQRSLPQQPNGSGSGNTKYNIGPNYIYAPGGPGGGGGGGGGGGFQIGGDKAIVSSKMSVNKPVFIDVEMPDEMKQYAVDCAMLAFIKHEDKEDMAKYMTKEFKKKYNGTWNCIVGPPTFGSWVIPEKDCYIQFDMGEDRIELFKSK